MPAASGEGAAGWRSPQPLSIRGTQRQPGAGGSSQTPSPAHGGSGQPCTWVLADYAHPPAFPTCACSLHACVLPSTHPQPPKHTQTNMHTDPAAHTHPNTHITTSPHSCTPCTPGEQRTSMHQHAHTCTYTLRLGLLPHTGSVQFACLQKQGHAQLCISHTGLLWSSHPGTNAHTGSAVARTRMHADTNTAWASHTRKCSVAPRDTATGPRFAVAVAHPCAAMEL